MCYRAVSCPGNHLDCRCNRDPALDHVLAPEDGPSEAHRPPLKTCEKKPWGYDHAGKDHTHMQYWSGWDVA